MRQNDSMLKAFRLMIIFLGLQSTAMAYEMEDVQRIDFQIRDPKTQELYFHGIEIFGTVSDRIRKETFYYDSDKKEVQYEDTLYEPKSLRVYDYIFRNSVTGEETLLKTEGEMAQVRYRAKSGQPFKSGSIPWGVATYHGKVFNNLVLRNWESLLRGKALKFDLLLPFRFETIGFQIVHSKSHTVDGEAREVFVVQPQNILVRALAPRMEMQYTRGSKPRIRVFTGPFTSPVKGESDKILDISFTYPAG